MKKGKIIAAALCMVIFTQFTLPVKAVEARYVVCPECNGREYEGESVAIELRGDPQKCSLREGCTWREGTMYTYKTRNCTSGCSHNGHRLSDNPIRIDSVRVHEYCGTKVVK